MKMRILGLVLTVALLPTAARADVKLNAICSEGMVLQQKSQAKIWGTASAGEGVSITFRDKTASAKSGAEELGVRAQPLTADLATALGSEGVEGVLVLEVSKESPADHAGLRAGDIIFKIGDQPVKDMATLDQAVAAATNPAAINMLRRGDQQMVLAPLEGHRTPASESSGLVIDEQLVIDELRQEVASLKQEMADLRAQIAKLVQEAAKPKP